MQLRIRLVWRHGQYCTQTPNKPSLRNHRTLDIGVLGYIGIVWPKEHSPEVRSFPPGTPCIYLTSSYYCSLGQAIPVTWRLKMFQLTVNLYCSLIFYLYSILDLCSRRGWGVSVTPRQHLTPGKDPVPIVQEAGWASGPQKHRHCAPQEWHLAGYVSTKKCAGIVGCRRHIFWPNHSINSKWQFLDCAIVTFSERY